MNRQLGFWARKGFHILINGSFAIVALLIPEIYILPLAVLSFISILIFEQARLKTWIAKYVDEAVGTLFKNKERVQFSSLLWGGLAGVIISLFASPVAISYSLAVLALADSAASIAGTNIRSRKIYGKKSVSGVTAAFLVTVGLSLLYFYFTGVIAFIPWWWYLASGIIITSAETIGYPFDDNFTILISSAFLMHLTLTLV